MNKPRIPLLVGTVLLLIVLVFTSLSMHTTSAKAATLTFIPSADAYVIATSPTTNYGTATILRLDNSPITNSYLRFVVSGLNGASVTSAKLRIYANSANSTGLTVHALANNTWTETAITYSNAPAAGSTLATSAAIKARHGSKWISAVTSRPKAPTTWR